jgi:dimethylhistidine N-methyltransferase
MEPGLDAPAVSDFAPTSRSLLEEVLEGLRAPRKSIPTKLLYDARGSELFEKICELEEYYLTRTELGIMRAHAQEMARLMGRNCLLIEYGSGNGLKTRLLLDHLAEPCAYVPIDISKDSLERSAEMLARAYPGLAVLPVHADYTADYAIPRTPRPSSSRAIYFPGSTIGNFTPDHAVAFLKHVRDVCGERGGLLIGIDLEKDIDTLERAYNDEAGVTAAFELNVLERLNRELGCEFRIERFEYEGFYNPGLSRIEMYLVSREPQTVRVGPQLVSFGRGERILIEYSYKYTVEGFARLAAHAGLTMERVWTDPGRMFAVQYLAPA